MHMEYLHQEHNGQDPAGVRETFEFRGQPDVMSAICYMCAVPGYLADDINKQVEKAQILCTIIYFTTKFNCLSAQYQREWYWVTDKLVPSLDDDNDNGGSGSDPVPVDRPSGPRPRSRVMARALTPEKLLSTTYVGWTYDDGLDGLFDR